MPAGEGLCHAGIVPLEGLPRLRTDESVGIAEKPMAEHAVVVVNAVEKDMGLHDKKLVYHVGTMIEVPRGALQAGKLAQEAEFFSFGTNDLTQLTMGFSRDDSGQFLPTYQQKKIYEFDPFQTIDIEGVGELVKIAVERGRATNPNLLIGVCGETGGDPASIIFYDKVGLDYVSCSPFRVPLARLAAAQAAIINKSK